MKKVILITLGIIVLVVLLIATFFYFSIPEMESKIEIEKITFSSGETVYLKKELRGLNYEVRVLSESPCEKFTPNPEQDYIYSSGSSLFYEFQNDTLFLYTLIQSKVPANFINQHRIKQVEIESYNWSTYREKGLREF